jgi:hypothetical protein
MFSYPFAVMLNLFQYHDDGFGIRVTGPVIRELRISSSQGIRLTPYLKQ